jgi:hypothetical protein
MRSLSCEEPFVKVCGKSHHHGNERTAEGNNATLRCLHYCQASIPFETQSAYTCVCRIMLTSPKLKPYRLWYWTACSVPCNKKQCINSFLVQMELGCSSTCPQKLTPHFTLQCDIYTLTPFLCNTLGVISLMSSKETKWDTYQWLRTCTVEAKNISMIYSCCCT